jgi:NAD(P)-dependent dehydrogenase (short-subunit alcohol dehydrogenase family)
MDHGLNGRVALVTGGARGLGRAITERLLELGASVTLNVRRPEQSVAVSKGFSGAPVLAIAGDITDPQTVPDTVARTLEKFGRLDILVNNAAFSPTTRFEQIPVAEWRRTLEVNLTGAFVCTQAVVPAMKVHGYGRVINISSTAGRSVSTLGGAHYTASKAGLLGLTRAAAKELGPHGITVNAVCPGLFDTELTRENATEEELATYARSFPVRRLGEAREVAELVAFLASPAAGYITGAALDINGGDLML